MLRLTKNAVSTIIAATLISAICVPAANAFDVVVKNDLCIFKLNDLEKDRQSQHYSQEPLSMPVSGADYYAGVAERRLWADEETIKNYEIAWEESGDPKYQKEHEARLQTYKDSAEFYKFVIKAYEACSAGKTVRGVKAFENNTGGNQSNQIAPLLSYEDKTLTPEGIGLTTAGVILLLLGIIAALFPQIQAVLL
ncbi:MAG: hypothetical protein SPK00_06540 [Corynebacterium glucuronolyticum]|nr:hypothetical protein [Corynebacterium glucuronolyticum]MDD7586197.1 hypothetical protein [Mycobacteriaceae bacterium]MDY5834389.1 hypothetical protein [Corynebacterium glucuronolyticum]